jgi:ATP-dependent DNA helicase RecQ
VTYSTALSILRSAYGEAASFRDGQAEAIHSALQPGARALVVQRTGWGKSIVYFIATRLLREQGRGPTLLVSPLLSLMRNQIQTAERFGIRAVSINSSNREEWVTIERQLRQDEIDLLLISPERLSNPDYTEHLLPFLEPRLGLLVIDEAHCISDWGHDFRPDYRRILRTVRRLPPTTPILGTTATANDRVIFDIRRQFDGRLDVKRGALSRSSLEIEVHALPSQAERLVWMAQELPRMPGCGIVYTLTINDARRVATWLTQCGIAAHAYHADLSHEERVQLEDRFLSNDLKCLVATTALGMGYDKADVAFVIHFQRPGSIISYYQQIGRAGRSIDRARIVLLTGREDDEIAHYFIESAFPGQACFNELIAAMKRHPENTIDVLTAATNQRRGQVEKVLKLLEVEEVVKRGRRGFRILRDDWRFGALRSAEITQQRLQEVAEMKSFVSHRACRMQYLAEALDDPTTQPCGRCDRCSPRPRARLQAEQVAQAVAFLCGDHPVIPRKAFYPPGIHAAGRKKIPAHLTISDGVALCIYNDAGWGRLVREGKYLDLDFCDELVQASANLVLERSLRPTWVAWVPSLRRPLLVEDFARRLADRLGIDAVDAVLKIADNPEQKAMQNATRQFLNIQPAHAVDSRVMRAGTCLLVDDVADSAWTLTTIGMMLREAGCAQVVPFALAVARARE